MQNPLDQPLQIQIIPPEQRKPLDPLEFALDRWGIKGKAINAGELD